MSLESELSRLNDNLEKLLPVLVGRSGTTVADTPVPKKEKAPKADKPAEDKPTPTITPEVVPQKRDADNDRKEAEPILQELLNAQKKASILEVNTKFGVKFAREVYGTDKFPEYLAEIKKLNAAA
jgi:hypothetical protein